VAKKDARRSAAPLVAVLSMACLGAIVVDSQGGADSPFGPVRSALGDALGPAQEASAVVARPLRSVPDLLESNASLRGDVARLQGENAHLRAELATTSALRARAAELSGLLEASARSDVALVPAQVVGIGPAQSFSRTVTIDAGTTSGVHADMTVLNNAGLVGRVIRADRDTATVLLVVDRDSVVGARLGSNAEVGFLRGRGSLDGDGRLDLDLVDNAETPGRDDVVVTWGSRHRAPYVPGVPIGTVEAVFSSPREQAKHAVIVPFVDFSSLDVVGVVVDADTRGDRALITAGEVPGPDDREDAR